MRAGKLRHRVTIQRPVATRDPTTNEPTRTWQDVATVWASVEPLSAREFVAAQAAQSQVTARVVIRHREGIDATMRVMHRGLAHDIQGVLADPVSGREYLTLPVSQGVTDGR